MYPRFVTYGLHKLHLQIFPLCLETEFLKVAISLAILIYCGIELHI